MIDKSKLKALNRFIDAVEMGKLPHQDDLEYVATALKEVLMHNTDAKEALGIKAGRGRPGGMNFFRKLAAIHEVKYLRGRGMTRNDALVEVSMRRGRIWRKASDHTIENWLDDRFSRDAAEACQRPLALFAAFDVGAKALEGTASPMEFWERYETLDQEDKDHPTMKLTCETIKAVEWLSNNPDETHYPVPDGASAAFRQMLKAGGTKG